MGSGLLLPNKLKNEPLIEAVFEFRFEASQPATDLIPGFLFGKLDGKKVLHRLPTAELPKPIRDSDPNLRFAPLVRLELERFNLLIGDHAVAVGCKLPYIGWQSGFREKCLEVVAVLSDLTFIEKVSRFSIKYVNLIPASTISEQVTLLKMKISIGDSNVVDSQFSFRVELLDGLDVHVVSILSGATATDNETGHERTGIVVDVDTIRNLDNQAFNDWNSTITDQLNQLRHSNKEKFFSMLKRSTIDGMGPSYE